MPNPTSNPVTKAKEFQVSVDRGLCFNCGVCMDVCPIRTLDMTRPQVPGPEATFFRQQPERAATYAWMMATPVQVDHCNGCTICVRECPTQAIAIAPTAERPALTPRPGPILVEPTERTGRWEPLSAYTRAAMKVQGPREAHDPWGKDLRWRLAKRAGPWQVWRTWSKRRDEATTR